MFRFFTENSLILQNQSGFKPRDSCAKQPLSITDDDQEVGQFQLFSWSNIEVDVPQGSNLDPLLFLINTNDLSDGLPTNAKIFADDVSLFLQSII